MPSQTRAPQFELVLPAYNEAKSLPALITSVISAARDAGLSSAQFQLALVDNGSTDDSSVILKTIAASPDGEWVRVVAVPSNRGYGYGVWSGLQTTSAPIVGWSHADLQCNPADAFKAWKLAAQTDEAIVVKGAREGRDAKQAFVSAVFARSARFFLGLSTGEINAQPKVFRRALLEIINNPPDDFSFDLYVLYCAARHGYKLLPIPVLFPPRAHGTSSWSSTLLGRWRTIFKAVMYILRLRMREGKIP